MMTTKKKVLIFISGIVFVGVIIGGIYLLFFQNKGIESLTEDQVKQKIKSVTKEIEKLILLPNEIPSLATVMDADVLKKNQPFYRDAQNGDIVLLYSSERKAIIYNPREKKLVNVGPIIIDEDVANKNNEEILAIEIRNGSGLSGKAKEVEEQLKNNQEFAVGNVGDASKTDYVGNILVDFTKGKKSSLLDRLQKLYNAEVRQTMPEGEADSSAEALLILGK